METMIPAILIRAAVPVCWEGDKRSFTMSIKLNKLRDQAQFKNSCQVLACLPNYTYWQDTDGVISGCNDKIMTLFGAKSKKNIIGKSYQDLCKNLKWLVNVFESLSFYDKKVLKSGKTFQHKLWLPLKKSSSKKILLSCIHKPLLDKKKIVGVIIELIDISEFDHTEKRLENTIKQAEKEIKLAALHLDRILAHLPCNVFWVNKTSANLGCNDNLAKLLGFNSREEIKGLTYFDMAKIRNWPNEQAKLWRSNDLEVMRTGKSNENINYLTDSKGEVIYQTTTRVPFRDEQGKIIGVIGISTDITDRVKKENELVEAREKAEIANQAKSDFLATVSHELRTPLNGIIGMTDLLTRQGITKDQRMLVEDITNSGKTLLSLINGILDLSKLDAGELEIINTPFDLSVIMDNVIKQISTQAQQKNVVLSTKFEGDVPTQLLGDSQRLYQILINLLGNAVKFTDHGKADLTVKFLEKTNRKHTLSFIIKDTGIGIPKDQINVIFDRFRQLDSSYSKLHSGTGLGLAIVKQLVELMNGEIFVDSKMGSGTTFTVNLSFTAQPEITKTNPWAVKYSNVRVLIIDDDLTVGTKILKLIHTPCVALVSSSSAFETLENAAKRNQHYQIVLFSANSLFHGKNSIKKLQNALPTLYYPMMLSYSDKAQKSVKERGIAFDAIQFTGVDQTFISKLSSCWKKYQTSLSSVSTAFADINARILLVEDNLINQRVTLHFLKELGCSADVAHNGILALKLFKKNTYDLILMDIGLPDMDGFMVCQKIRALERKDQHIPIIALTAYASENDKQKCLNAGMDNVLTKPINSVGLLHMLSTWLLANRITS
jgi:two-component system sensor histidine kinase/response regulator